MTEAIFDPYMDLIGKKQKQFPTIALSGGCGMEKDKIYIDVFVRHKGEGFLESINKKFFVTTSAEAELKLDLILNAFPRVVAVDDEIKPLFTLKEVQRFEDEGLITVEVKQHD